MTKIKIFKKRRRKPISYTYDAISHAGQQKWWLILLIPMGFFLDCIHFILSIIKILFVLLFIFAGFCLCFAYYIWNTKFEDMYIEYKKQAIDVVKASTAETFMTDESSFIYDSDGKILAKLRGDNDSSYLQYEDIPQYVVDAYVAVEDRTFWDNEGYDLRGIARVCINYLKTDGTEVHGASTITQQLVRNAFLTREVSIERKAKEILMSYFMTQKYSKEEIMEFYVNDICYANGIYGIEAASLAYFNKHASDLSLSQVAYLCAIPNSPSMYNPYTNPERAMKRRDKILDDMLEMEFITQGEYETAMAESITIERSKVEFNNFQTTYAVDCAVRYLMKMNGFEFKYEFRDDAVYSNYQKEYASAYDAAKHQLYTGGYRIYTTLDSSVQDELQNIVDDVLAFDETIGDNGVTYALQGAVTCIDNQTGKVIAVVGGRSQDSIDTYGINRAYQAYRQPGSSIKPLIVYAPALERGYTPERIVQNIDVTAAKAKDVDVQSLGGTSMTLLDALTSSKNGVAWKLFDEMGPEAGLSYITAMNYSKVVPDDYYNSASLGGFTYGVTTVEQASGFSTLANHGIYREPTCISSMFDSSGTDVFREAEGKQVYSARTADTMISMMQNVVTRGTAAGMKWSQSSKLPAAAKTGTTNDSKDGWLCGVTPYYSIAVWVGFDTPKTLSNLWGSTYPAQIWKQCMLTVTDGLPVVDFEEGEYYDVVDSESSIEIESEYLPGRSDDEMLSEGYYVRDYRSDRAIGEQVQAVIEQMNAIEQGSENAVGRAQELYNQGQALVDSIYSRKYTAEVQSVFDSAYSSCIMRLTQ